jgi:hypothetical protein
MPAVLAPPQPVAPASRSLPRTRRAARPVVGPQCGSDVIIGLALTTTWMLITGRCLDHGPLLHGLPAADLIDFWADDYFVPADKAGAAGARAHADLRSRP